MNTDNLMINNKIPMKYAGLSSPGKKEQNEDRFLIKKLCPDMIFLALADGLGGQPAGHIAAQTAIQAVENFIPCSGEIEKEMGELILKADDSVTARSKDDPALEYMGTTLTIALFDKDRIFWAHVGDARIYHLKENELFQITLDQTMAQFLVEEGEITREEAMKHPMQNFLAQSLGGGGCEPQTGSFQVTPGEIVMLCSDGLYSEINAQQIVEILSSKKNLKEKICLLVSAANDAGGHDNITALGIEF